MMEKIYKQTQSETTTRRYNCVQIDFNVGLAKIFTISLRWLKAATHVTVKDFPVFYNHARCISLIVYATVMIYKPKYKQILTRWKVKLYLVN